MSDRIYNRFDSAKHYDRHLFRADRVLQSAEFNELQSNVFNRIQNIADVLFGDGDIVRDAGINLNSETGAVRLQSGALYLAGAVRGVAPADFIISLVGTVVIGVYLNEEVITELHDSALRNPATGTRGYMEPGAARMKMEPRWGLDGDGTPGQFYPVYTIIDGQLYAKEPPPALDAFSQALARYDRDSAGSNYVVSGMRVLQLNDLPTGEQVYSLTEGRARVNGYGVQLNTSRRIIYPAMPQQRFISSEPHASETMAAQRITLDRYPAADIKAVRITTEDTFQIMHGTFSGASDPLPKASVVEIVAIQQNGVTFVKGTDYKLTAGQVDWSLPGNEPAPGSTYNATIRFITDAEITDVDTSGFTVAGAVVGSLIMTDYLCNLPRIDRLCLNEDGEHIFIEGVATDYNPVRPPVPSQLMPLAQIIQTWDGNRRVVNDGARTVPMSDIESLFRRTDILADLVAQQNLKSDISTRESAAKKGVFVDPFLDDSHRDAGVAQTAASFDGVLTLPIAPTVHNLSNDITTPQVCGFNFQVSLAQTYRTGEMKINPYMSFGILPGVATVTPAIDRWTEVQTEWASPVTQIFNTGTGTRVASVSTSSEILVNTRRDIIATLRQIDLEFNVTGFGANEKLAEITFDGVAVQPNEQNLQANMGGQVRGSFTIPADIPTGSKLVTFRGAAESHASTTFFGEGIMETNTQTEITTITTRFRNIDPLAQTFTLSQRRQFAGVELFVTAVGDTPIIVQVRETQVGLPTNTVLAEAQLSVADLQVDQWNRWEFQMPVDLMADVHYSLVVLCNDPIGEIAIAELGKFDRHAQRWVTSQPYQVGVLLSSSNAITWTPHQDRDMAFRLLSADYIQPERVIDLGHVAVENATDLITLLPAIQSGTNADCELILTLPNGTSISASDRQVIRLSPAVTGEINISARLRSNGILSAMLLPGTQVIAGTIAEQADYVSRATDADAAGCNVQIIFDAQIPSGAGVMPYIGTTGENPVYTPAAQHGLSKPVGDGVFEYQYRLSDVQLSHICTKLSLTGNTGARPFVENLRVIVTE